MSNRFEYIRNVLRKTSRCRPEVREAAEALADMSTQEAETLAAELIESGAEEPLGILMLVIGLNRLKLDPVLLAKAFGLVTTPVDLNGAYAVQGEAAIEPLLAAINAPGTPWEIQAYGGRVAAELAVAGNADRAKVSKTLHKLAFKIRIPELNWLVEDAIALLESESDPEERNRFEIYRDFLQDLPEARPLKVIGGGYTVRRPIAKIGRNEPCPCGSGRKYKKCCLEKDRERMRDASPYEGITMSQLRASPDQIDDDAFIQQMSAAELNELDAGRMNNQQLLAAYRRAQFLHLYSKALDMLAELQKRPGQESIAAEWLEDLLYHAVDADESRIVQRVFKLLPSEFIDDPEGIAFQMQLLSTPQQLRELDAQMRRAVGEVDETVRIDNPVVAAAHFWESRLPALSIIFARAAIAGHPDHVFDNEILMDVIRSARLELELDPYGDPAEELFEWTLRREDRRFIEDQKDAEIENLRQKVAEAEKRTAHTARVLLGKERELADTESKLKASGTLQRPQNRTIVDSAAGAERPESHTVLRLRSQVERLKAEVGLQQQERRQLRRQLTEERKRRRAKPAEAKESAAEKEPEQTAPHRIVPKNVCVPEFCDAFRRSCENLPAAVVAQALRASIGCALHEPSALRKSRPIESMPGLYRLRIGNHRLIFRRDKSSGRLEFLDLIKRQDLETWLRCH